MNVCKFGLLLTCILAAAGATAQKNNPALAQWRKQAAAVSIIRDNWGIPHVYGNTDADAVFGLMYAQCEDDFWSVEEYLIGKLGRKAELYGEKYILEDLYAALYADTVKAKNAYLQLPLYYRQLLQAHADALNYYIFNYPEKARLIKLYKPWFLLMKGGPSPAAVGLSTADVYAYLGSLVTDSSRVSFRAAEDNTDGIGSNGWALAPGRTTSGHTFLFINPHGAITGPGQRLEVHINSRQGLNAYGAPFTGLFTIWQGFNAHIGWARTVQYADMNDLYALTFDKAGDPLAYRFDDTYKRARVRKIGIVYKSSSGTGIRHFTTLVTQFGPVVGTMEGKLLALKDSTNEAESLRQDWDITRAHNFTEFKKAWSATVEKPCTMVYADAAGKIAYWHANMVPVRDTQFNWTEPVNVIGTKTAWKGIHKVDEVPHVVDPGTGFIQNSNSVPWIVSGAASPDSARYPAYMSYDARTLRSLMGMRLFDNAYKYSIDSFTRAAMNNRYLVRYELLIPSLLKQFDHAAAVNANFKSRLQEPVNVLRNWDYRSDTGSVATTLAVLLDEKLGPLYDKKVPPFSTYRRRYAFEYTTADDFGENQLLLSLAEVVTDLRNNFGTWQVPWGNISRLQRIHPGGELEQFSDDRRSIAVGAVQNQTGSLFDFASRKYSGTRLRYGFKGNTFVAVVDFGEKVVAKTILVYGESADRMSPHYFDQAQLYADGKLKDAYFYREDVQQHAERTYHPGE